jgi:SAM-dependent methyltransferase
MEPNLPKEYLSHAPLARASTAQKLVHKAAGAVLFPLYWAAAYMVRTPGLPFRRYCASMGMRLLLKGGGIRDAYSLLVFPMDSVRYFEFDFMWHAIKNAQIRSYLDVSSPRLFPLVVLDRNAGLFADLINPDGKDLHETIRLATALGVSDRCRFHAEFVESSSLAPGSFDVITSISVVEHIPDDTGALRKMWDLLRPGGRLLISMPCAANASEEHAAVNEFGLLSPDESGFFFWQRYYDERLLRQRIFCVTGEPLRYSIYGERKPGNYARNVTRKKTDPLYPHWREPLMMGLEYEHRSQVSDLAGIGVIAMEFVK